MDSLSVIGRVRMQWANEHHRVFYWASNCELIFGDIQERCIAPFIKDIIAIMISSSLLRAHGASAKRAIPAGTPQRGAGNAYAKNLALPVLSEVELIN